jgi:predicted NBD/HSP70 family sugar kinase
LKISNRRTVYSLLRQEGEMSKAEIMRRTGISTPTVLKITDYFMSLGLLAEAGEGAASIGRKPTLLRIVPDAIYTIGAVFDGRGLSLGLVDLFGAPRGLRRVPAPASLERLLGEDLPIQALRLIEEENVPLAKVKGIGVGVPGVVDPSGATVRFAPLAGIQKDFNASTLLQSLERRLGMPVRLENDANAAALGEHSARSRATRSRAAERPDADGSVCAGDFIFVELGRGLGAGIILDGKLRKGSRAMAGEIGYLVLDPSWKATSDAPGWLEGRLDLDEFWAEVDGHKTPSKRSLRRVISYLALGLSNISLALDLDLIVVGRAGLEHFGDDFLNSLKAELARFSVLETSCVPSLLEEPGVSGAAGLVADAWLEGMFSE